MNYMFVPLADYEKMKFSLNLHKVWTYVTIKIKSV